MTSKPSGGSVKSRFQQIAQKNAAPKETTGQFIGRNVAQHGARAAETVLGLPGSFKKAFQQSLGMILPEQLKDLRDTEEQAFGKPEQGSVEELVMNPPTPGELRESVTPLVSEKLTGKKDYLEPKGKAEAFAGDLTQDLTSFFLPGTGQMKLMTRIGVPIAGNLAKEGIKYLGGSESAAEKTKLGVMMVATLAGQSDPSKFASQRIGQSKKMVPQDATLSVERLENRLGSLKNNLNRGLKIPSKSRTTQGIDELLDQIDKGRMSIHSLMDARDNINEWISEAGGWDVPANTRDASIRNLNSLKREIIDTIDENLQQRFPQAADLYRTGYEAAAITHKSNAISNFIEKNFGKKIASTGAKLLFPAVAGGAAILPKTAAVAGGLFPIYKSGQVLYRVAKSPTLAGYYSDVIKHSLQGNAAAMSRSLSKLDEELVKEEKKESKGKKQSLVEFKEKFKNRD